MDSGEVIFSLIFETLSAYVNNVYDWINTKNFSNIFFINWSCEAWEQIILRHHSIQKSESKQLKLQRTCHTYSETLTAFKLLKWTKQGIPVKHHRRFHLKSRSASAEILFLAREETCIFMKKQTTLWAVINIERVEWAGF